MCGYRIGPTFLGSMLPQYMPLHVSFVCQRKVCVRLFGDIVGASPLCVGSFGNTVGASPPLCVSVRWVTLWVRPPCLSVYLVTLWVLHCMLPSPLCGIFFVREGEKTNSQAQPNC